MKWLTVCSLLLALASIISADEFDHLLRNNNKVQPLLETTIGLDKFSDQFYSDNKASNKEFKRINFAKLQVTLGGTRENQIGPRSLTNDNLVIVGQKSTNPIGTNGDRWDVKQDSFGGQYFSVYTGDDEITNYLRANFLRNLANRIQGYVAILDQSVEAELAIKTHIKELVQEIADKISTLPDVTKKSQGFIATVILTKGYMIAINVGQGKIMTRGFNPDGFHKIKTHVDEVSNVDQCETLSSETKSCLPHVRVHGYLKRGYSPRQILLGGEAIFKNAESDKLMNTLVITLLNDKRPYEEKAKHGMSEIMSVTKADAFSDKIAMVVLVDQVAEDFINGPKERKVRSLSDMFKTKK